MSVSNTTRHSLFSFHTVKVGLIVSILAQPFEVLRTSSIMKETNLKNINFKGLWYLIKEINRLEGYRGFFRGGSLAVMKNSLGYALFFTNLENFETLSQNKLKL